MSILNCIQKSRGELLKKNYPAIPSAFHNFGAHSLSVVPHP